MSTVEAQADNQPKSASDDPLVWIDCEVRYDVTLQNISNSHVE